MGSIYSINRNPKIWEMYHSDKKLKEKYGGESLVTVIYGTLDDYPQILNLEMYMRESVYNKLMSGEYTVSKDSVFCNALVIVDSKGERVLPVLEDFCY